MPPRLQTSAVVDGTDTVDALAYFASLDDDALRKQLAGFGAQRETTGETKSPGSARLPGGGFGVSRLGGAGAAMVAQSLVGTGIGVLLGAGTTGRARRTK